MRSGPNPQPAGAGATRPVTQTSRLRAAILLAVLLPWGVFAAELRVMSFNIWRGGEAGGQPLEQTAAVIRAARADLVGLQETGGLERDGRRPDNGRRIADLLGWHYFDQGGGTGVASRHPIAGHTPQRWGVIVNLPSGRRVTHFNVHFSHAPYQPYQLLRIPYHDSPFVTSVPEVIREAHRARGGQVERMLTELTPVLARGDAVFLTGDFNEPSHQDWTERAAAARLCPIPVPYPATRRVAEAGMRDSFRVARPDEVLHPGWTWTPLTRPEDPADRHDRIDFVFFGGPDVRALGCEVVGESATAADVVVTPYPSDHRGVVGTFRIEGTAVSPTQTQAR